MKQALSKAYSRFFEWIMHPGITRYNYPDPKAAMYRYPSPGSLPVKEEVWDYKEPFSTSRYNIRFRHETPQQL